MKLSFFKKKENNILSNIKNNPLIDNNNIDNKNEIKLIISINEKDINKDIYFLDNINYNNEENEEDEEEEEEEEEKDDDDDDDEEDEEEEEEKEDEEKQEEYDDDYYYTFCKYEHNKINEMNKSNIDLYVNDIKYEFQKYFNFKKPGEFCIKIKFKFLIKDCGFMFYNCKNIIKIDLSNFNSSNVVNMEKMFFLCTNLININFLNFETKNVTNMNYMFFGCKKLKNIDLSNFDTQNVINMEYMFCDCEIIYPKCFIIVKT